MWPDRGHVHPHSGGQKRFGAFLDRVQREPVRVMRHQRVVGVRVGTQGDEALRAFYSDRLRHTRDESAAAAAQAGMNDEVLERLRADEG